MPPSSRCFSTCDSMKMWTPHFQVQVRILAMLRVPLPAMPRAHPSRRRVSLELTLLVVMCAAFVLIDDGAGFGAREWKSIMNLNASEKRTSPKEIGRFGMGSRSFFHYADVTTVTSRGSYVGVDPLEVVKSFGRTDGWKANLLGQGGDIGSVVAEANSLFSLPPQVCGGFDCMSQGAMFRLPLRRSEDVQREVERDLKPFGAEIPTDRANALMSEWAELAPRLLLFLFSVSKVTLWRWAPGAPGPECLASAVKRFEVGSPFLRLPASLPEAVVSTYKTLARHLVGLSCDERAALSELHVDVIHISASGAAASRAGGGGSTCTTWLVAQRFDVTTPELFEVIQAGCDSVPVVGVAVPTGGDQHVSGVPFYYLPIGSKTTGLPVHVHGAFASTPNRRDLWLPGPDVDGQHATKATWNDALMRFAVPRLWLDVLFILGPRRTELPALAQRADDPGRAVLSRLPDLDQVEEAWRPCAERLYELLRDREAALLPHPSEPRWVSPSRALAFSCPTAALEVQKSAVMTLYATVPRKEMLGMTERSSSSSANPKRARLVDDSGESSPRNAGRYVVMLPAHVRRGCEERSGLCVWSVAEIVLGILRASQVAAASRKEAGPRLPVDQLRPVLLALLPHAANAFSASDHEAWRATLRGMAWLQTQGGDVVALSAAFASLERLEALNFQVVARGLSNLGTSDPSTVKAAILWGLKDDLTWADCVHEARTIADEDSEADGLVARSERLLAYMAERSEAISAISTGLEPKVQQKLLSKIAFHPAHAPLATLPADEKVPRGPLTLKSAKSIQSTSDAGLVWAVAPSATSTMPFLKYAPLSKAELARQLVQLAAFGKGAQPGHLPALMAHLLRAATKLAQLPPSPRHAAILLDGIESVGVSPEVQAISQLSRAAWIPAIGPDGGLQLLSPQYVAYKVHSDLWPRFGRLPDAWQNVTLRSLLVDVGVRPELSCAVLARELESLASPMSDGAAADQAPFPPLASADLLLSVRIATELAMNRMGGDSTSTLESYQVFVPTVSGRLLPSAEAFINDAKWHAAKEQTHELLHELISQRHGAELGCSSVRQELARLCEDDKDDVDGEVFEQNEPLARRIEGLLAKYDAEMDVFVEHYQNCDDAGATEVLFLLDAGNYSVDQMLEETSEAARLQGPALLLASSRALSEDDLRRIRRLGASDKRSQFASAGRFGLGLNSFYHLSDCPQIYARDTALVILDPLHTVLSKDGMRYKPDELKRKFSSMLEPFAKVAEDYPTIFRLPLRTKGSNFGKPFNVHHTKGLFDRFQQQASELLLLAKNVTSVEFAMRAEGGEIRQVARMTRSDTGAAPAQGHQSASSARFMQRLPNTLSSVLDLESAPREGLERITITHESAESTDVVETHWLIAHSLAADADSARLIRESFSRSTHPIALLPHGATALRLGCVKRD